MEKIANFVYNKSKPIIVTVIIINIAAIASFFRFDLSTDFLSFFTQGNPRAEEYHQLNEKYQIGEIISILVEQDNSMLTKENLRTVFELQQQIESIEGVKLAQSFIPPEIILGDEIIIINQDFIESNHVELVSYIENSYFLTDQLLAPDGESGLIVASLEVDTVVSEVIKSLEEIIQNKKELTLSLAGNEIIKDTLKDYLIRVLFILPPSAILLVALVFFAFLRKFRFALLALIPAGFAAL